MKIESYKVEVEAKLILNRRELELLHHICSYDQGAALELLAVNAESGHYAGGVTKEELKTFLQGIRGTTCNLMEQIQNAKAKLFPAA